MDQKFRKLAFLSVFISLFLSSTLLFFGPLQLYYTNIGEFSLTGLEILPYIAVATIFSTAILAITALLFKKTSNIVLSLIFSIGLCLWIQGNLLTWNYGLFDGKKHPLEHENNLWNY